MVRDLPSDLSRSTGVGACKVAVTVIDAQRTNDGGALLTVIAIGKYRSGLISQGCIVNDRAIVGMHP